MTKQAWLKIINALLGLTISLIALSVLLYRWIPNPWQGSEALSELHEISGMAFFVLVLIHLFLNGQWLKSAYGLSRRKK